MAWEPLWYWLPGQLLGYLAQREIVELLREYVSIGDAGQRKQNEVATLAKSGFGYASDLAPKIKQVAKATTAKSKVNKRD